MRIKQGSGLVAALTLTLSLGLVSPALLQAQERQGLLLNANLLAETDDNVLRKINAVSDSALKLSPEVSFLDDFGKHQLSANYQGEYASYSDNGDLNYDSHDIKAKALFDHSYRINSELQVGYKDQVEDPGTTNSSTILINTFNNVNESSALAKVYFGRTQSTGQIVLAYDFNQQRYTNNLQGYRDVDRNKFTGTYFYRISPKTRMLFEASLANYEYDKQIQYGDQSSDEMLYLAGAEWSVTAKTTGVFKIGYQSKDYENDYYSDISGLSYLLDMIWKPNTYSTVTLGASRLTTESAQFGIGGFISTSFVVGYDHELSRRTQLKINYQYDIEDISWVRDREDTRHDFKIGINYSLQRWLDLGINYRYLKRDSSYQLYGFESNSFNLSLTSTFE